LNNTQTPHNGTLNPFHLIHFLLFSLGQPSKHWTFFDFAPLSESFVLPRHHFTPPPSFRLCSANRNHWGLKDFAVSQWFVRDVAARASRQYQEETNAV
jgi:hypothetical protein